MNYRIRINNVIKYLQNKGWSIEDYDDLAYKIKLISNEEEFEIIIPKKESLLDYNFRISQLINSLSNIEGRKVSEVREDLENMGFDVVRFRFKSEKYEDGMPLNDFASAVDKIYNIVKFEACSELNPQSQYTNPYEEAKDLLAHCEVPQTEKGSYIINLKVPLGETYLKIIKEGDEYLRFLGRNTIVRTLSGINEAKTINITNENQFKQTYDKKLNKNSCGEISELLGDIGDAKLDITTRWEATKPIEDKFLEPVTLSKNDIGTFETMVNYLTDIPADAEKIIEGKIVDMRRSKENEKEQTIIVYDDNLRRNISVELSSSDYEWAIELYHKISKVMIKGILKKKGRWVLENYKKFDIQKGL